MANKYPANSDDGELTDAEKRRLIDEIVTRRMQIVSDDDLATYWARKREHDDVHEWGNPKGEYPPYDPSRLHALRAILTEDIRLRVMQMVHFPLDGDRQQDALV